MAQPDLLPIAVNVFSEANVYDKVRSGYKTQTIKLFLENLGFPLVASKPNSDEQPITLVELGAGTGQFTKALAEAAKGTKIQRHIASEPVESMRNVSQKNCPAGVEIKSFRAEKIRKYYEFIFPHGANHTNSRFK